MTEYNVDTKKILWLNWKDLKHPQAGGAEIVNEELAKRLAQDGHEVIFIVSRFPGAKPDERRDGFRIIRLGNRYTVYWHAFRYYTRHLVNWPDIVIDEINTVPFFAKFYVKAKRVLFIHQLCREIWFYQLQFPLSWIGYWGEPAYLRLLKGQTVITVSQSTKQDLIRLGFHPNNIFIISEGITIKPVSHLARIKKSRTPTILSLGALRAMKRNEAIIQAFEAVWRKVPNVRLVIAGPIQDSYGRRVIKQAQRSPAAQAISYLGPVNHQQKVQLLQQSHILCVTSVKEGWGLTVTEANSQGTPAVVYNVDGLRDSVRHKRTGLVSTNNSPERLAHHIISLLRNPDYYGQLQKSAWEWSKKITFDRSYTDFLAVLERI